MIYLNGADTVWKLLVANDGAGPHSISQPPLTSPFMGHFKGIREGTQMPWKECNQMDERDLTSYGPVYPRKKVQLA